MNAKQWFSYIFLSCIWGSSFLWIKIAVQESEPLTIVTLRLLMGLVVSFIFLVIRKPEVPGSWRVGSKFLIQGLIGMAIPWILIFWAEQYIDSTVATVLNATVPLFTVLMAHVFLHDDPMTFPRIQGLFVGFLGVIVLVHEELIASLYEAKDVSFPVLLGYGAMLLSSAFYGTSSVHARAKFRGVSPIVQAFYTMLFADVVMWSTAPFIETPFTLPVKMITWTAILWLGVLGAGLSFVLFYYLLHSIGPTRVSTITYIFPVVGVSLGVMFLGERLEWSLVAGTILILSGVCFTNRR